MQRDLSRPQRTDAERSVKASKYWCRDLAGHCWLFSLQCPTLFRGAVPMPMLCHSNQVLIAPPSLYLQTEHANRLTPRTPLTCHVLSWHKLHLHPVERKALVRLSKAVKAPGSSSMETSRTSLSATISSLKVLWPRCVFLFRGGFV